MEYPTINKLRLHQLCNEKQWFTEGTNEQYTRLFYANDMRCPVEELATIIWLCSDTEKWCRRDILQVLKNEQTEWQNFLQIGGDSDEHF